MISHNENNNGGNPIHFQLWTGYGLALLILVTVVALGYLQAKQVEHSNQRVSHTHEVMGRLEGLLIELVDAETGQRGYLLTGEPGYLEPYHRGKRQFPGEIEELQELTSDNPRQQKRIQSLKPQI